MSINKRRSRSVIPVFMNPKTILFLFLIAGVYILIKGFIVLSENKKLAEYGIEGQGITIDVMCVSSENENPYYHPLVVYTASNGETYQSYLPESVKKNSIGDTLTFKYLEESPDKIYNIDTDLYLDSILMWSFGSVIILIVFLVWKLITSGGPTRLKSSYTVDIVANVVGVSTQKSHTMNGSRACYISAVYPDPQTDEEVYVRSKDLWYDPSEYLPKQVNIKVHPYNRRKYWMDTSFLPKRGLFGRR